MRIFKLILLKLLSCIVLFAPIVIYLIAKRDVYFVGNNGTKMTLGLIIGLISAIFCMLGLHKNLGKLAPIFWATLCLLFSYLMSRILDEIIIFEALALVGIVAFTIVWSVVDYKQRLYNAYLEQFVKE